MDYYPQDLLVGVFPLVFAVSAILDPATDNSSEGGGGGGGGGETTNNQHNKHHHQQRRTLFDRFLDVVAASLVDDFDHHNIDNTITTTTTTTGSSGNDKRSRTISLFRPDDDEDSSDEEDNEILQRGVTRKRSSSGLSAGFYAGFGRNRGGLHNQQQMGNYSSTGTSSSSAMAGGTTTTKTNAAASGDREASYAKALTHGQGFFQRARIEAVSTKHGFPPSKDPQGNENLAHILPNLLSNNSKNSKKNREGGSNRRSHNSTSNEEEIQSIFNDHPIGGIITAGWLEKHVHALPSVILVVCSVSSDRKFQAQQDKILRDTVSHLSMMLMPKRQCTIHIIGLMQDNVTLSQGDIWSKSISNDIYYDMMSNQTQQQQSSQSTTPSTDGGDGNDGGSGSSSPPYCVTLLRASSDLQAETTTGQPSSLAFRRLHQSVRDASMVYYLRQARRTKEKLGKLLQLDSSKGGGEQRRHSSSSSGGGGGGSTTTLPPQLLPLVIRYCFKIAMFYEFQWKFEKSLRFMVEAYRYSMKYYEYLLSRSQPSSSSNDYGGGEADNDASAPIISSPQQQHSVSDAGDESFEVSLANDDNNTTALVDTGNDGSTNFWETAVQIPDDMVYQIKAVAEWLNLKLLQAGFASHTEGGLLAASNQWRHHCRLFCTMRSGSRRKEQRQQQQQQQEAYWWEWSYIARQRLVMSELVERHPPKALGDLGNDWDEIIYRCSPWITYESAVEATLRIARELDKPQVRQQLSLPQHHHHENTTAPKRARYVGGLDSEGLLPELREISKADHRAKALEIVLRAIALYEHESEKEKRGFYAEDNFSERSSSRAGARLYYLAGGILLGMERQQEAVAHLEKASKFARGWRELEVSIRRMLIECYEKHLPSSTHASEESSQAIASMILDSYFNADMSPRDLRRALGHFASTSSGGGSLKWYHETVDEEDKNLPLSFAVSFPGRTHATAGDTVEASVLITSNLDYAVHVNSVVLLSLAGQLPIPSSDLLCATNVSEGSEGGIIIQSKTSIIVSTRLELPRDTSIIAVDDSGNGGEMQGVAGKGSFAKSARPRTAGITSAGGARLVAEGEITQSNRASQGWSLKYLGGKPLRCDGVRLVFYPVQIEKATGNAEAVTHIELTIQKKKPKTLANIKRTPFEEENYIASAWSRPLHLPLSRGPRTLRVLGPMPQLVIKDLTEEATGGKVVEGTVNRILLKLTAGPQERCNDVKYRVSCFSVLLTPTGSTRRLVSQEEIHKSEGAMDMKNPRCRTPTLVAQSDDPSREYDSDYGYQLPQGWCPAESGQSFTGPTLPLLACGDSKFVDINFYRPSPIIHSEAFPTEDDENVSDVSLCKTDYYITVSYRQERTAVQKPRRSSVRGRRRRPVVGSAPKSEGAHETLVGGTPDHQDQDEKSHEKNPEDSYEEVSLEFTGSVVWGKALKASFQPGTRRACPSGSRSKSNSTSRNSGSSGTAEQLSLVEAESVTTRCSFQADSTVEGLKTEIIGVRFEGNDCSDSPVSLSLQSHDGNNVLYSPETIDPCRILSVGSKLSVAYTVKPTLKRAPEGAGAKSNLGTILIDWKPSSLPLPSDARLDEKALGGIHSHGPLRLHTPSTIRFSGPGCWIESAPFEAEVESTAVIPRMGVPFVVNYRVSNKTNLHQLVSIKVGDSSSQVMDGLVFAGMTHGELPLAPFETQTIAYTILSTRAGRARLPAVKVSSNRYQSWIVKEASKEIHIFP